MQKAEQAAALSAEDFEPVASQLSFHLHSIFGGKMTWEFLFMFYLLSLFVNNAQRLRLASFGEEKDGILKSADGNTSRITVIIKD